MKLPAILLLVLGGVAGSYYFFLYPPKILERKTAETLTHFATDIESQDRAKISESLQTLLTDSAQIHLEVRFFSITQLDGGKPVLQDFDKASFITFIDNLLFTLTDYHYEPALESFTASSDRKTATASFSARKWADGKSTYGGSSIAMRFSADTTCDAQLVFTEPSPRFEKLDCKVFLRSLPKPDELQKMKNPEALGQYLR